MYSAFALCPWHFQSSLFQCLHPLLQFQLHHVFIHCAQHHISCEHHLPRCFFLMFSASESIVMANRKLLNAYRWWSPATTAKGSIIIVPAANLSRIWHYRQTTPTNYVAHLNYIFPYAASAAINVADTLIIRRPSANGRDYKTGIAYSAILRLHERPFITHNNRLVSV